MRQKLFRQPGPPQPTGRNSFITSCNCRSHNTDNRRSTRRLMRKCRTRRGRLCPSTDARETPSKNWSAAARSTELGQRLRRWLPRRDVDGRVPASGRNRAKGTQYRFTVVSVRTAFYYLGLSCLLVCRHRTLRRPVDDPIWRKERGARASHSNKRDALLLAGQELCARHRNNPLPLQPF
jgi:hypothetical protein